MSSATGATKPMASSTMSAGISNSLPGISLNLSSTRAQTSLVTLPPLPSKRLVVTAKSRLAPSACDDDVRIFSGQFGQDSALFSFSGGAGMISSCVTLLAPWRIEVPMQSLPVSPPPMTTTCLALGEIFRAKAERFAGDAAVLLRQEVHGEMDAAQIAAGHREIARLLGAAGQQHGVVFGLEILDPVRRRRRACCNGTPRPRLPSA